MRQRASSGGRIWAESVDCDGRREPTVPHNLTHSLAVASCFALFLLYSVAIAGTRGSAGFGSVRRDESERMTL